MTLEHDNIFDNMYAGRPGKSVWHRKGRDLSGDDVLPSTAVHEHGMDYPVTMETLYIRRPQGVYHALDEKGVVRGPAGSDSKYRLFNTVSDAYPLMDNAAAFALFDPVVTHAKWPIETMLVLGQGERAILSLNMGKRHIKSRTGRLDEHDLHLAYIHDYENADRVLVTDTRIVCQNTYMMAMLGAETKIRIVHNAGAKDQIADVVAFIAQMHHASAEAVKVLQAMAEKSMDADATDAFVKKVFPVRERTGKEKLYSAANRAEMQPSTAARAEQMERRFEQAVREARRNQVQFANFIMWEDQNHPEFEGTVYSRFNALTNYANWGMGDTTSTPSPERILLGDRAQVMNGGYKALVSVLKGRS